MNKYIREKKLALSKTWFSYFSVDKGKLKAAQCLLNYADNISDRIDSSVSRMIEKDLRLKNMLFEITQIKFMNQPRIVVK